MRAVVQRVCSAEVTVDGEAVGGINVGLVVYLGVGAADSGSDVDYVANKILGLRVFPDGDGVMNRSIVDLVSDASAWDSTQHVPSSTPGILVVSQFTLYGDVRKGRRPSYNGAARPEQASSLYSTLVQALSRPGIAVETGAFQAHMHVSSINDGPVTILIDSEKKF